MTSTLTITDAQTHLTDAHAHLADLKARVAAGDQTVTGAHLAEAVGDVDIAEVRLEAARAAEVARQEADHEAAVSELQAKVEAFAGASGSELARLRRAYAKQVAAIAALVRDVAAYESERANLVGHAHALNAADLVAHLPSLRPERHDFAALIAADAKGQIRTGTADALHPLLTDDRIAHLHEMHASKIQRAAAVPPMFNTRAEAHAAGAEWTG